jgi:transketolase
VPEIYDRNMEIGLPTARVLKSGYDVSIIACGVEVHQALLAADVLAQRHISAEVIDVLSVAPLDEETILASVEKTGCVVTCEEHNVATGMGSAISAFLAEHRPTPMKMVGMRSFGESGVAEELLAHFGLDAKAIVESAQELLSTRNVVGIRSGRILIHDLPGAYH